MITIRGKVIEQTSKGADEHIDKLAKKYLNTEKYPGHSSNMERVILRINPISKEKGVGINFILFSFLFRSFQYYEGKNKSIP